MEVFFNMGPERVPPKRAWNTSHLSCAEGGWKRVLLFLRISDHDRFDGNVFPNGPACHVRREGGREWDGVLLYLHIIDHDGIGGGVFLNRPGTRPTEIFAIYFPSVRPFFFQRSLNFESFFLNLIAFLHYNI